VKKLGVVLKKMKCKKCGKKNPILEVVGDGLKIKYAPCMCTCENMISSEKWERGSAEVDLLNEREVIQYIRDLLNLSDLLEKGFDTELFAFIQTLKKAGYGDDSIHRFYTYAGYGSRFELLTDRDGHKVVPRAIPEKGEYKEWLRLKQRAK